MVKQKKQKKILIGILMGIGVIALYGVVYILQVNQKKQLEVSGLNKEEILLSDAKRQSIEQFANEIVDEYPIEGHAMVVIESELISHDQYKRYLVEVNTVAISKSYKTDLYTYYVVIQESLEDEFYVMPFGVETIKGNEDHLKREIIISMMKVVNGWGSSAQEFESRWSDALLAPYSRTQIIKDGRNSTGLNLDTIYYIQGVLKYMDEYLCAYKEAVENNEYLYIKKFIINDKEYGRGQYEELEYLKNEEITRKVINSEVIGITIPDRDEKCLVVTRVDTRTYLNEEIVNNSHIVTYQVGLVNEEEEILDVLLVE